MFDFAWSEIALVGVVALIAIGPKDMPVALKAITDVIKKARRMAAEFQTHVDELVREADLHEVRDQINEIRSLNIRGQIAKAIDSDGSLRRSFEDNPFATSPGSTPVALGPDPAEHVIAAPDHSVPAPGAAEAASDGAVDAEAPAFIPPGAASPARAAPAEPVSPPPAFIPPDSAAAALPDGAVHAAQP